MHPAQGKKKKKPKTLARTDVLVAERSPGGKGCPRPGGFPVAGHTAEGHAGFWHRRSLPSPLLGDTLRRQRRGTGAVARPGSSRPPVLSVSPLPKRTEEKGFGARAVTGARGGVRSRCWCQAQGFARSLPPRRGRRRLRSGGSVTGAASKQNAVKEEKPDCRTLIKQRFRKTGRNCEFWLNEPS